MDALKFALSRLGEPHRHHRHCVHNLSADEQKANWRRRVEQDFPDDPDAAYELIYGDSEPITCTPDEWEIDVPDLTWDGGVS
jgi:hypothetical protein